MKPYIILAVLCSFALGMTSCKDTGNPNSESNAERFRSIKDSITILDSLVMINKFNNRDEALHNARRAIRIAIESKDSTCYITAYNMMGNAFSQSNFDSCYYYYSSAQRIAENVGVISQYPQVIYNIAYLHYHAFDYKTAIFLFDSVIKVSKSLGKWDILAGTYNILGNAKSSIGLKDEALDAYKKAEILSAQKKLPRQLGISYANQATFESNIDIAKNLNRKAIFHLSKTPGEERTIALILGNLGFLMQTPDSAIKYYYQAIDIANKYGFTDILINTYNNLAYSHLEKEDIKTAELIIKDKALPLALSDTNLNDLATLYDTYSDICKSKRRFEQALEFQKQAMSYRSQADQKIASDQARLLSALLEAKNRELLINNQEMEIRLQSGRKEQYRSYLFLAVLLLIGLVLTLVWYRQRNRLKMQKERLNSAQRIIDVGEFEKKQIGRELHDISTQLSMGLQRTVDILMLNDNTKN